MEARLYAGNLSFNTSKAGLADHFGEHAAIKSCDIIMDKFSGRSRGFGFVEVDTDDSGALIEALNATTLDGRTIVVNEARPREPRYSADRSRNREASLAGARP